MARRRRVTSHGTWRRPHPIEALFKTPSRHRVRHGRDPCDLNPNSAGVLIIQDRLFGACEPERDGEPCRNGIVKTLGDFTLLRVAFHDGSARVGDVKRDPAHALG